MAFGAMRFLVRAILQDKTINRILHGTTTGSIKTLIAGAGDAGVLALRELSLNSSDREVVGFLDDDPLLRGSVVHGVEVIGTLADAHECVQKSQIDEILIAIPSAPREIVRRLAESCAGTVSLRILPSIIDFITGDRQVEQIRAVKLEDLLGREPVKMDCQEIAEDLKAQTILVSGAAGSIGSELARQIARCHPKHLILLDNAESPLFEIHRELADIAGLNMSPVICDVKDAQNLHRVFEKFNPDYVYHAAAYKHVPLMEDHPLAAVTNNIFGTQNLAQTAIDFDVEKFVMVSTDKAVSPENIMGATKRVCERIVSEADCKQTRFMSVRFGNVLGSNGSVVPIFKKQIEHGGPVTVTDPETTRYFMTIPEAVELILQAGTVGQPGDIFVLDMGDPVRIVDLARAMIVLGGLTPDKDIQIKFIGLRPGEKLHEKLVFDESLLQETGIPKLRKIASETVTGRDLSDKLEILKTVTHSGDLQKTRSLLFDLAT